METTQVIQLFLTIATIAGMGWKLSRDIDGRFTDEEKERSTAVLRVHDRIDKLWKEHENERVAVAQNYSSKAELKELEMRIEKRMDQMESRIVAEIQKKS